MIDIFPCSDIWYNEEKPWKKEKYDDSSLEDDPVEQNEINDPLGEE